MPGPDSNRNAYFGDLHVHTAYSLDGYVSGSTNTPDDAYAFGKGETKPLYAGGPMMRLTAPLDFMAVTDHSEWMGEIGALLDEGFTPGDKDAAALLQRHRDGNAEGGDWEASMGVLRHGMLDADNPSHEAYMQPESAAGSAHLRSTWKYMADTAAKHYEPGKFTTFIGYEWSATPNGANLHRCVIFSSDDVPEIPLSYIDTQNPEDLWKWMQEVAGGPDKVQAIPHNSNQSQGLMFLPRYIDGRPIDRAYAETRSTFEPLIEMHQIKGNSEANPAIATTDEFADFEQIVGGSAWLTGGLNSYSMVRDGLKEGLRQADRLGVNPFRYGFIGSTDTHTGLPGDTEETDWDGHFPGMDTSAELRLQGHDEIVSGITENPGGLAGVWAEENTRESIFGALRRKETFGTSGVRIRPRFFGGWDDLASSGAEDDVEAGYQNGVPMGSELPARPDGADAPSFAVRAIKDPLSGNLDRIQVVKGWADCGEVFEKIYDVAWSGNRVANPGDGRVPPVGNTVDIGEATYTNDIGAPELGGRWTDPDFDPAVRAFYYSRIIEIPTPRWSTYDAKRLGIAPHEPATVQERAWTSPIWYTPSESDRAAGAADRAEALTVDDLAGRGVEPLADDAIRSLLVGRTVTVRNVITGESATADFGEDGTRMLTIPPHQVISGAYEIADGRLSHQSADGLSVAFRFFEVDGRYLAARDDHGGYVNLEVEAN